MSDNNIETLDIEESPERNQSNVGAKPEKSVEEVVVPVTNIVQKYPTSRPAEKWNDGDETLALPSGSVDKMQETINNGPNIRLDDNQAGREWSESLSQSVDALYIRKVFDRTMERENAEFHQAIDSEKMPLAAGIPNIKYNNGDKVSGERAALRIRSLLGMGTILQIPLWHSGFWITVKAPSEGSLLELQRRLIESKVHLGRQTHGLAFANTSVYIAGWLIDFALAHVYDSTIKGTDIDYRKLIRVTDIPTIIWGLACTVWPSGFQYTRACIADPQKCNHVIREKLNLGKLHWVDRNSLTARQISHMSNRGGSTMSLESIHNYNEEFLVGRGRTIQVGKENQVKINLKVPTVEEYVNSGYKWVNNIVQMIDASMTTEPNDTTRNVHITQLGKATSMRQYAHWVESIMAEENVIDDVESIEQVLDIMGSDDLVREKFFEEVVKFIDDVTIATIAVPTYECPACKNKQPATMDRFPHLLPIDVMSSFFTLLVQKLLKIQAR